MIAIILGYFCANYIYHEYEKRSIKSNTLYFLQISASNNDNSDSLNILNKLTIKEDKYYTYIGITMDKNIAEHIKDIYKKDNIDIYIKKKEISNSKFLLELEQYDILLRDSNSRSEIDNILKSILSSFEESINI